MLTGDPHALSDSNASWVIDSVGKPDTIKIGGEALETDGSRLEVEGAAVFGWWGCSDCTFDDLGVGMMGPLTGGKARTGFVLADCSSIPLEVLGNRLSRPVDLLDSSGCRC